MALARVTRIWFDQPQKDRSKETQWYVVHLAKFLLVYLIMDQNYNHWECKNLAILEIVISCIDRKGELFFSTFFSWRLFCFTFVTFVLTQAISFSGVISNGAIRRDDGRASRHFEVIAWKPFKFVHIKMAFVSWRLFASHATFCLVC